ncbi:MAG: hypothetical protein GY830_05925 [Bacteroidetes bacterium]|nr:hypothetical protein [Bacteroidota bacterium]
MKLNKTNFLIFASINLVFISCSLNKEFQNKNMINANHIKLKLEQNSNRTITKQSKTPINLKILKKSLGSINKKYKLINLWTCIFFKKNKKVWFEDLLSDFLDFRDSITMKEIKIDSIKQKENLFNEIKAMLHNSFNSTKLLLKQIEYLENKLTRLDITTEDNLDDDIKKIFKKNYQNFLFDILYDGPIKYSKKKKYNPLFALYYIDKFKKIDNTDIKKSKSNVSNKENEWFRVIENFVIKFNIPKEIIVIIKNYIIDKNTYIIDIKNSNLNEVNIGFKEYEENNCINLICNFAPMYISTDVISIIKNYYIPPIYNLYNVEEIKLHILSNCIQLIYLFADHYIYDKTKTSRQRSFVHNILQNYFKCINKMEISYEILIDIDTKKDSLKNIMNQYLRNTFFTYFIPEMDDKQTDLGFSYFNIYDSCMRDIYINLI